MTDIFDLDIYQKIRGISLPIVEGYVTGRHTRTGKPGQPPSRDHDGDDSLKRSCWAVVPVINGIMCFALGNDIPCFIVPSSHMDGGVITHIWNGYHI